MEKIIVKIDDWIHIYACALVLMLHIKSLPEEGSFTAVSPLKVSY